MMSKLSITILFLALSILLQAQDQNSLLWKIQSKDSGQESYLFGTMHSRDKRIFNLDTAIVPLMLKSALYVPEVDLNTDLKKQKLEKLLLPEGRTLKDLYTKAEYELIAREFDKRSSKTLKELNKFQPLSLLMFREMSSPYFLPLTLDEYLYKVAKDQKKEIHGLETVEEQISFLIESQNVRHVYNYFKNIEKFDSLHDELRLAYVAEDHRTILRVTSDDSLTGYDMDVLNSKRNRIMTSRIDSLTQIQSAFFAIGVGHLFGETGIINGLRKLGYTITPIRNEKKMHQLIEFEINWQDYESVNNNFTIKFPDTPIVQKSKAGNLYSSDFIREGLMSMTFTVNEHVNQSFRVMNTETMSKAFLHQVESGFSKEMGFTSLSTRYFLYNGLYAKETLFRANDRSNLIHSRFILAEDKLYTLNVLVNPNTEDLASIQSFMNSFNIQK